MSPLDRELTRLLARSSLGDRLVSVDGDLRRLITADVFDELDADGRRHLERLLAEAGGRALYAFLLPYIEAVTTFVAEHRDVPLQADRFPAPVPPPRAGDWIRTDADDGVDGDGLWHLFGGDLRLRVVGRRTETFAEARCGRLLPVSSPAGPANLERRPDRPTVDRCRACRRISVRPGRRPRPRRSAG